MAFIDSLRGAYKPPSVNAPALNTPAVVQPTAPATPSAPSSWGPYGPIGNDPGFIAAQNERDRRNALAAANYNQRSQASRYAYNGAGNPYSILNLLKQSDADNTRAYMNNLAARGILRSGETGYQAGQEAKLYGQALYKAQQELAALLSGYQQDYLGEQSATSDMFMNALNTANENWQKALASGDPGIYGYWNANVLPNGKQGWVPYNPNSAYQSPVTGGSLITQYLK